MARAICHDLSVIDPAPSAISLASAGRLRRARLAPDDADSRFVRRVIIVIVVIALSAALYRMGDLLILAFGAILGAIAIHAIADLYRGRLGLNPRLALGAGITTVLALLGFLFWLFGIQFGQQINTLVAQFPSLLGQLSRWLSQSPMGAKLVSAVNSAYAGSKVARDLSGLVLGGGELVLNFLLLLVGALFFAADPGVYERGFVLLIPPSKRDAIEDALFDAAATLKLWLRAQLIQMTTMGVLIGLGLWFTGVPSAAALGLLAGLSEFIPYVGPTAAMLPALGLAATAGTGPILGTLATYALVRVVQSNFITPFVTNRVISIPPAVTLFAILGIGAVFGVFGLFFSAALLVVIFTLVRSLYLREVLGEAIPHADRATAAVSIPPAD
ncbi:AI-2E family transporter [uncultured Sphingomonas sp.]|uniref:AI-2E family transporter n=1 Tax=uncultured Sphingomonas sp. TaxID=158754 RepID=UPI0035CC41B0